MAMAESAAARGEPWLSFFDPSELAAILRKKGFGDIEDVAFADTHQTLLTRTGDGASIRAGGHVIRAAR